MFQWLKYFIFFVAITAVIIAAGYFNNQQNASITSVQEVNTTLQSNVTGHIRTMQKEDLSKKEIAAGLIAEAVNTQKSNLKKLKVEFMYLDKNGVKTTNDKEIDSVQIRTSTLTDKGDIQTLAVQRISLRQQ